MDALNEGLRAVSNFVWGPYLLTPILLGTGLFISLRLKFIQFRGLPPLLVIVIA